MTFEKIRVGARMKLVGKVKTGNLLIFFSVCLRVAVYLLAFLTAVRFPDLYSTVGGRAVLALCAVAVFLCMLILQCTRTVKDRWFSSLNTNSPALISEIVVSFTFSDILKSVKCSILSFVFSFIRVVLFGALPSALTLWLWIALRDGVSRAVLFIFLCGFVIAVMCSAFFMSVSLGCVSLARSLCSGDAGRFVKMLKILEKNFFRLFRYSLFLSTFNRCSRRFSKIVFAGMLAGADYTFL